VKLCYINLSGPVFVSIFS